MKRICLWYLCGWAGLAEPLFAQSLEKNVEQRLIGFFENYQTSRAEIGKCKLDHFTIDHQQKTICIYANAAFGYQPFTEENTKAIYRTIKQLLPGPVNYYRITTYADGLPIEELIPNAYREKDKDKSRLYGKTDYKEAPWTQNISRPFSITEGLQNRHLAVWQSHGKYYKNELRVWKWQRPALFGTTEDFYTQSIVVPYLIPMLENAGAVVFTPRERDWQRNEVIVDNDASTNGSRYLEVNYKKRCVWSTAPTPGFAHLRSTYTDNWNPFTDGKARYISTLSKPEKAFAEWIPNIPQKGKYAVYVSYQTLPESVSDAKYLVFHNGGVTEFKVNQQMGGGTWVYLGSFEFDKGANDYGMVVLSNESSQNGVVCADAVRFGGGMGNIERGGHTSGLPRYLEGARYWAQWAGMPYSVYSKSGGKNDYADDINARSLAMNYLSGGSVYNPREEGLHVPFELSFAMHSDAGFNTADKPIGSLAIYTTDFQNGQTNCGVSRYASRDLADMILTGLQRDISSRFGIDWPRRGMWNRNYSETRLPAVPSIILETLSHQNFTDLKLGYEPDFKFTVGRAVYKALLKYTATMHRTGYTVQPLPVSHFAIHMGNKKKNTFELSWASTEDPLEKSAKPQGYIVYTRIGRGGFDNGTYVKGTTHTVKVEPGIIYSFKVTAVNKGGESFPSETLAAYKAKHERGRILIVNAFHYTGGPASIHTPQEQGFDLRLNPGIPYHSTTAFCGYQHNFSRKHPGLETPDGLGFTGNELEGMEIAGNTFDYPFVHGKAIQKAGSLSFVSCSIETVESGSTLPNGFDMIDLIYGAEQSILDPHVQTILTNYCKNGGRLLVSGTHIGSTMGDKAFTQNILKYTPGGSLTESDSGEIQGSSIRLSIPRRLNEKCYAVPSPSCILPTGGSFPALIYAENRQCAGTAYKGNWSTFCLGFPFECIDDENARTRMMRMIIDFLWKK